MKGKETYDRAAVGLRLRRKRMQLGWTRRYVSEKIGLVEKYYSDIERGSCGMSVETLMGLSKLYDISMDDLIYGGRTAEDPAAQERRELLLSRFDKLSGQAQEYCMQLLLLFMEGIKEQKSQKGGRKEAEKQEALAGEKE